MDAGRRVPGLRASDWMCRCARRACAEPRTCAGADHGGRSASRANEPPKQLCWRRWTPSSTRPRPPVRRALSAGPASNWTRPRRLSARSDGLFLCRCGRLDRWIHRPLAAARRGGVYAVDVGHGQLAWTLRNDPRVTVLERTNIRHLESLPELVHCAVIDVSFICCGWCRRVSRHCWRPMVGW